jgi:hypothetical protein
MTCRGEVRCNFFCYATCTRPRFILATPCSAVWPLRTVGKRGARPSLPSFVLRGAVSRAPPVAAPHSADHTVSLRVSAQGYIFASKLSARCSASRAANIRVRHGTPACRGPRTAWLPQPCNPRHRRPHRYKVRTAFPQKASRRSVGEATQVCSATTVGVSPERS